ncbi:hybrid sensor histidine kinase/response regulator [Luteibacter yeojuensis]|uniref:histidine kinase n=1 Tax=Luteibacter yeojuensis TaxID=345309 RepID=A0A0F3KFS5_9GAMM|nr:PAS domain-containing sensor histidine kinase [Luteibacter yeojuensis]KJV30021.1 histidine kinase [Luteibacter yeojuensis]
MLPFPLPVTSPAQLAYQLLQDSDWAHAHRDLDLPVELRTVLSMIMDSPEPLWIAWGAEEKAFFFNDAYLPFLGGKLHGAMGNRLDVVWADVWADVAEAIDDAFAGRHRSFKNLRLMMDRDGTPRETFWTFSYSPLRMAHGGVAGIICAVTEQTEQVAERDLHVRQVAAITQEAREAHLELVRAREQLRQSQKLEAMGQLTGGVAHDFNNLLQVITGSVDMLLPAWPAGDPKVKFLHAISGASERAARLTAQLLAFSRRQSLSPEVFDAGDGVRALTTILATVLGERVALRMALPERRLPVLLDRSQFDTALINIAANARDATNGTGEVTITLEPVAGVPAVRMAGPLKGPFLAIHIRDSGAGIEADVLGRIFEPFFTTKAVGAGTGLGLSQVFGFVKQSEGEVDVTSVPGYGTTFTLYLPLTDQPTEHSVDMTGHPPTDGAGRTILVVEDNADVADFAVGAVASLGYGVVLARNAESALDELRKDAARFHAVFSDVVMPGVSGLDLGLAIRVNYPRLPVILTSGYSELLSKNPGHGFRLLKKPYSLKQLADALASVETSTGV